MRIGLLLLVAAGWMSGWVQAETTTRARLILGAEVAQPGETVLAGVELKMEPGWHTYWRNGGDAGSPTEIQWTLPEGMTAGGILWPVPEKFETAGLYTYGYHDEVVLLVPLTLSTEMKPGVVPLSATVSWLECKELCVPGEGKVAGSLTVGDSSKPSGERAVLAEWQSRLPAASGMEVRGRWDGDGRGDERGVILEWPGAAKGADFYPFAYETFEVGHATERLPEEAMVRLRKTVLKYEGDWPERWRGLIVERDEGGALRSAREVEVVLVGHYGDSGVLWIGLFLVALALAAWILGRFVQRGGPGGPVTR